MISIITFRAHFSLTNWSATWKSKGFSNVIGLKFESCTRTSIAI